MTTCIVFARTVQFHGRQLIKQLGIDLDNAGINGDKFQDGIDITMIYTKFAHSDVTFTTLTEAGEGSYLYAGVVLSN